MSPMPQTRDQLVESGYKFIEHANCRGANCRAEIEWWETPKGKNMPFDSMLTGSDKAVSHWGTCRNAGDFRK